MKADPKKLHNQIVADELLEGREVILVAPCYKPFVHYLFQTYGIRVKAKLVPPKKPKDKPKKGWSPTPSFILTLKK